MIGKKPSELAAERRKARQEEMLKANLKRRKDQARARKQAPGDPEGPDDGPPAVDGDGIGLSE